MINVGVVVSLLYWAYLDMKSLRTDSKLINFLKNHGFRMSFGVLLSLLVFTVSISLFSWIDPYYIAPISITIFYMTVVYRKKNLELRHMKSNDITT